MQRLQVSSHNRGCILGFQANTLYHQGSSPWWDERLDAIIFLSVPSFTAPIIVLYTRELLLKYTIYKS